MCEMYLERIFLDLIIIQYLLLEAIFNVFVVRRIPLLKQGRRWKLLKGSEEHWQWRIKQRYAKGAQKAGLFGVQVT